MYLLFYYWRFDDIWNGGNRPFLSMALRTQNGTPPRNQVGIYPNIRCFFLRFKPFVLKTISETYRYGRTDSPLPPPLPTAVPWIVFGGYFLLSRWIRERRLHSWHTRMKYCTNGFRHTSEREKKNYAEQNATRTRELVSRIRSIYRAV